MDDIMMIIADKPVGRGLVQLASYIVQVDFTASQLSRITVGTFG